MKNTLFSFLMLTISFFSFPAFSQTDNQEAADTALLGLPGDNLDLFAVLDIFQQSKTIEDFEKTLNLKETGINNLDLDLNDTVDFIKVVTKQDGNNFTFILQVDVSAKEIQDVAVILVSKDKDGKVTMQIVGDKDLYGEGYVVEPKPAAPAVTPNPAYAGTEPVPAAAPATTTVVVVESAPVVQYVYSPVYVPYYPPYYYRFYPPYFVAFSVMAVSVYRHHHYYHHVGYHGGYHGGGNTVVIHNENHYNNYNISRNRSNTVNHHNASGNYNRNNASTRPSAGTSVSTHPSTGQSKGTSASARPSTTPTTGQSKRTSASSTQPSTSNYSSSSASRSGSKGSSRSGGRGRRR